MKNFVMNAKIDPKVVTELSLFKIGGWNILQPSNRKLFEEFIEENEPQLLLIGIPHNDLFLGIQCMEQQFVRIDLNVKEWMPCDMRQHFAERYWLRKHPGRRSS